MSVTGATGGLATNESRQKGALGGGRHAQDHGHGQTLVRMFLLWMLLMVMLLLEESDTGSWTWTAHCESNYASIHNRDVEAAMVWRLGG